MNRGNFPGRVYERRLGALKRLPAAPPKHIKDQKAREIFQERLDQERTTLTQRTAQSQHGVRSKKDHSDKAKLTREG